jgi:hypothetical protein
MPVKESLSFSPSSFLTPEALVQAHFKFNSMEGDFFAFFRYARHPALLGIELLNEPSAATVPLDTLVSYYKQGYQIVRKYSSKVYVIICQRIGNADPLELYQANIGSRNIVVDLHFYNLFGTFFVNMSTVDNIQFIYKSREAQLQAINSANSPLVFIGKLESEFRLLLKNLL